MTLIPALSIRDARIYHRTAAALGKEPWQIGRTILGIASKVIDAEAAETAEDHRAVLRTDTKEIEAVERVVRVKPCADWRYDAADARWLAVCLRGWNFRLELHDWVGVVVLFSTVRKTEWTDAASFGGPDLYCSGRVECSARPIELVGVAVEIEVFPYTTAD